MPAISDETECVTCEKFLCAVDLVPWSTAEDSELSDIKSPPESLTESSKSPAKLRGAISSGGFFGRIK